MILLFLRPVLFGLAIAAAVIAGNRTDSFWIGLLTFLIASGVGRTLRRLVRGRTRAAVRAALWAAAATGFVVLFDDIGLPKWEAALLAFVCAGLTKSAVAAVLLPRYRLMRLEEWGLPGPDDIVEGRWTEKESR